MVTRQFRALVREAGLPPIRLHDLRHGAASIALVAGVGLKVVSDMLGHSSPPFTADVYTYVFTSLKPPRRSPTPSPIRPLRRVLTHTASAKATRQAA